MVDNTLTEIVWLLQLYSFRTIWKRPHKRQSIGSPKCVLVVMFILKKTVVVIICHVESVNVTGVGFVVQIYLNLMEFIDTSLSLRAAALVLECSSLRQEFHHPFAASALLRY